VAMTLYDDQGCPVSTGKELGRGGEGVILEVQGRGDTVAKIYHRPLDTGGAEKMRAMAGLRTGALLSVAAWPTGVLFRRAGAEPVGILMPKISGHREIHQLFSPVDRRVHFPKAKWKFLVHTAMNCAAAVENVHSAGQVIGDLNERGFMVSPQGTVRLIDCDSFQIRFAGRTFRCLVGTDAYTPPEMQGRAFSAEDRTTSHDCFGLAVLIFQLLFMGRHPFVGRYTGSGDAPAVARAISEGRFAFSGAAAGFQMAPPPHALHLDAMPQGIGSKFEDAFSKAFPSRPTSEAWRTALGELEKNTRVCDAEPDDHEFPSHLRECPWCRIERQGGVAFFTSRPIPYEFDDGFDLESLYRQIAAVPHPPGAGAIQGICPQKSFVGEPIPPALDLKRLPPARLPPPLPSLQQEPLPSIPQYQPRFDVALPEAPYQDEPLPDLPTFQIEASPIDPPLALLKEPETPSWQPRDHVKVAKDGYRRALSTGDYKRAKYGMILSAVLLPFTVFFWAAAIVIGVFLLAFGVTFLSLWLPEYCGYRRERNAAARRVADESRARQNELMRIDLQRAQIRETNEKRVAAWRGKVEELTHLRGQIAARNIEGERRWRVDYERVAALRQEAAARNAARQRLWGDVVRQREAERVAQWEGDCKRIEAKRALISERNAEAKRRWEAVMRQYNEDCEAVRIQNGRLAEIARQFEQERSRRSNKLERARSDAQASVDNWSRESRAFQEEYRRTLSDLENAKRDYEGLKQAFVHERNQIMGNRERIQRNEYLRQFRIEEAVIASIGPGRKSILVACGVETALDINPANLARLQGQGFGPELKSRLQLWRDSKESGFRFDPNGVVRPEQLRTLHAKFRSPRAALQSSLCEGPRKLRAITDGAGSRLAELENQATVRHCKLRQAEADLAVMNG